MKYSVVSAVAVALATSAASAQQAPSDCNQDGIDDVSQCRDGTLVDLNSNSIPDCCEVGTPCVANLIYNGSFEYGLPQQCGWVCIGPGDDRLTGWDVVLNTVDRQRTEPDGCNEGWLASHGNYSVDLNGCSSGGAIRQRVTTIPSRRYRLSFSLSLNPMVLTVGQLRVRVGLVERDFEFQRRQTNPQPNEQHAFEFVAADSFSIIEFESLNDNCCGPVVDGIRLEEVADPCPADTNNSGAVNGVDLAIVLGAWGTNGQGDGDADINNDGIVNGVDLAVVLAGWGPCP